MSVPITFAPPKAPSESTSTTLEPRVLIASYGDGFEQRLADGRNNAPVLADVTWNALEASTDADTITAFFAARGGVEPFEYALPPSAIVRRWVCETWSQTALDTYAASVSAQFREVFDL
jgi:phage-related protein